jgi:hypothetical protein
MATVTAYHANSNGVPDRHLALAEYALAATRKIVKMLAEASPRILRAT